MWVKPLSAYAVMRPDHAQATFNFILPYGVVFYPVASAQIARDRLSTAAAGTGVCTDLKVHFMAAYPGPLLPGAGETFRSRYSVACRGRPALDCRAGKGIDC